MRSVTAPISFPGSWPAIACVDVPSLPLQLVWRDEPTWRREPVVVVDDDHPQGLVRWACERARSVGVLPGQRYGSALSRCPGLRARVVSDAAIAEARDQLSRALHTLTPRVELAADAAGSAWLDGKGLAWLHPDPSHWANAIAVAASALGFAVVVVAGFSRFATFAIARVQRPGSVLVFSDEETERIATREVPLARLELAPTLRDALDRLGVTTLGGLVRLPGGGILERFGTSAHRLYQLASGEGWDPLHPARPPEAVDEQMLLDEDERDVTRLCFGLVAALDRLLARLAAKGRALTALHVDLTVRHAVGERELRRERLAPARPTLDGRMLMGLLRLRLESSLSHDLSAATGVHEVRLWADDVAATREQLALFAERPRRDLRAASDAVARLRAELGDDAVVRAELRDGHLPEARFGWVTVQNVHLPKPTAVLDGTALSPVRRVLGRPRLLPTQPTSVRDDGWCLTGLEPGSVVRLDGPYLVSGGWWAQNHGVERDYHLAETQRGDRLWIYYDRVRRRWFQHGAVE